MPVNRQGRHHATKPAIKKTITMPAPRARGIEIDSTREARAGVTASSCGSILGARIGSPCADGSCVHDTPWWNTWAKTANATAYGAIFWRCA